MMLTSVSSSACLASLPSLLYRSPVNAQIGGGQGRRIGFWGGVGMKCRFINSAGAKSLERRLVAKRLMAKRLAGSSM